MNKEEGEAAFRHGVSLINDHATSLLPFLIQRVDPTQLRWGFKTKQDEILRRPRLNRPHQAYCGHVLLVGQLQEVFKR